MRFASDSPGQVTGIRYYKAAGNTGAHTGALYTADGQQLAAVTFTGESSSGWQTASFSQPVDIAADTEYVASYRSPTGVYSAVPGGFGSGITSGPLRTAFDSGAYTYNGDFPSSSSTASYLVDVDFVATVPPLTVTAQMPAADSVGFPLTSDPAVTLSAPIQAGFTFGLSANGATVAGTSALSADAE